VQRRRVHEPLPELDAPMLKRLEAAQAKGQGAAIRGRARCRLARATVGFVELDRTHPFANINLTDNIVRFVTEPLRQNPLVVQGPAQGPPSPRGRFRDLLGSVRISGPSCRIGRRWASGSSRKDVLRRALFQIHLWTGVAVGSTSSSSASPAARWCSGAI
jgi:hypothetical protein